jgi:hypothetical protein
MFICHCHLFLCHSHLRPSIIPTKVGTHYFFIPKGHYFSYYSSTNSKNSILILEKVYVKYEGPRNTGIKKSCKNEKKVLLNIASNCGNIYACMFNAILQSNK